MGYPWFFVLTPLVKIAISVHYEVSILTMNLGLLGYQHLPDEFSRWLEQSEIQVSYYKTAEDFLLDD